MGGFCQSCWPFRKILTCSKGQRQREREGGRMGSNVYMITKYARPGMLGWLAGGGGGGEL